MNGIRTTLADDFRMPFGQYKGSRLADLPEPYLLWLSEECKSPSIRRMASQVVGLDQPEDDTDPLPTAASVVLPRLVFDFQQAKVNQYHNDPAALAVVRGCVVWLQTYTTTYTRKNWPATAGEVSA